jgi:hypothetical protein
MEERMSPPDDNLLNLPKKRHRPVDLHTDPLTKARIAHDEEPFNPGTEHLLSSIDGDVQSQGIQLSHRDWLDMGSEGWQTTSDEVKSAAFQAATKVGGWDIQQLKSVMLHQYPHLQESVIDLTLQTLQSLTEKHPLHVEDVSVKTANVLIQQRHQPQKDIAVAEAQSHKNESSPQ